MVKKTSKQNLSHYQGTTFNFGELIPVQCLEAVQGDTFKLQTQAFLRLAPMVFPVVQPIWVRLHHWYVPYRQLWAGYEEFATGKDLTKTFPFLGFIHTVPFGTLYERMGIAPQLVAKKQRFYPILPILAYWKIWKEFYADEQLDEVRINAVQQVLDLFLDKQNPAVLAGGDLAFSDVSTQLSTLMGAAAGTGLAADFFNETKVAWHKDYFTGARPTPIINGDINISATFSDDPKAGFGLQVRETTNPEVWSQIRLVEDGGQPRYLGTDAGATRSPAVLRMTEAAGTDGTSSLQVSLSDLMAGFALQRIFQDQNMYGNRYQEWLAGQGVKYSDKTLQLPKYIGGGKDLFDINEVIQTSGTSTAAGNLGNFAGRGTASVSSRPCYHYCEEAGVILTLASIVPKNMYSIQGIRKNWARRTFEETYQPQLEHLDMQPIKNSEIFISDDSAKDTGVFGYTPRYDELRTQESFVSGKLVKGRDYAEFTMSRNFTATPVLNSSFIQCNPDKSIFYDQADDSVIGVFKNKTIARRHLIKRSHIKLQ